MFNQTFGKVPEIMSTRCGIALENDNGSYTFAYCHNDGYPSWVGRILLDRYTDRGSVEKLVALGAMSSLGPIPADSDRPPAGVDAGDCCLVYHEPNHTAENLERLTGLFADYWSGCEFLYLFRRGWGWDCFNPYLHETSTLIEAVERDENEHSD